MVEWLAKFKWYHQLPALLLIAGMSVGVFYFYRDTIEGNVIVTSETQPMMSMRTFYTERAWACAQYATLLFSYPIPVHEDGSLKIAFLYFRGQIDFHFNTGRYDRPPHRVCLFDPRTGALLKQKRVTPKDFGRSDNPDLGWPSREGDGLSLDQFTELQAILLAAYDVLVPLYARGGAFPVPPEAARAAEEFQRILPILAGQDILPYYRALGKHFFAWLDGISPPVPPPPPDAAPPDAAPAASTPPSK